MSANKSSEYSVKAAKGTLWAMAGSISLKLISFIYVIFIARIATQEDVGLFYLALGVVSLVTLFTDLGLSGSLVRYIPYFDGRGEKRKTHDLLNIAYTIILVIGVIASIILFLSADLIGNLYGNPRLPEAIRILSVFVLLNNLININNSYLNGHANMRAVQEVQNLQNIFKLILTVVLFQVLGPSAVTLAIAFILSYIPAILFSIFRVFPYYNQDRSSSGDGLSKNQIMSEVLPFGVMLTAITSMWIIISLSDRLLLGYLLPHDQAEAAVAIYTVSITLVTTINLLPGSIGSIFLPLISRIYGKEGRDGILPLLYTAQRWCMFITFPACLVFIIFSNNILALFYGSSYSSGSLPASIFTVGLLLSSISMIVSLTLAALRMVGLELRIAAAGAVINILLCFLLIPNYGMVGAAVSSVVSFAIITLALIYYARKIFGFKLQSEIVKLMFSVIIAFGIILLLKPYFLDIAGSFHPEAPSALGVYGAKVVNLAVAVILSILTLAIFLVVAFLLKCFHNEDVSLMKQALIRLGFPPSIVGLFELIILYGVHEPTKNPGKSGFPDIE